MKTTGTGMASVISKATKYGIVLFKQAFIHCNWFAFSLSIRQYFVLEATKYQYC